MMLKQQLFVLLILSPLTLNGMYEYPSLETEQNNLSLDTNRINSCNLNTGKLSENSTEVTEKDISEILQSALECLLNTNAWLRHIKESFNLKENMELDSNFLLAFNQVRNLIIIKNRRNERRLPIYKKAIEEITKTTDKTIDAILSRIVINIPNIDINLLEADSSKKPNTHWLSLLFTYQEPLTVDNGIKAYLASFSYNDNLCENFLNIVFATVFLNNNQPKFKENQYDDPYDYQEETLEISEPSAPPLENLTIDMPYYLNKSSLEPLDKTTHNKGIDYPYTPKNLPSRIENTHGASRKSISYDFGSIKGFKVRREPIEEIIKYFNGDFLKNPIHIISVFNIIKTIQEENPKDIICFKFEKKQFEKNNILNIQKDFESLTKHNITYIDIHESFLSLYNPVSLQNFIGKLNEANITSINLISAVSSTLLDTQRNSFVYEILKNKNLKKLHIGSNWLNLYNLDEFAKRLSQTSIKELSIYNNDLSKANNANMKLFSKNLQVSNLKKLNLSKCKICNMDLNNINMLFSEIKKSKIKYLNLCWNSLEKLDFRRFAAIWDSLKDSKIEYLNLGSNHIDEWNLETMAGEKNRLNVFLEYLKNSKIKCLNIMNNSLKKNCNLSDSFYNSLTTAIVSSSITKIITGDALSRNNRENCNYASFIASLKGNVTVKEIEPTKHETLI